MFAPNTTRWIGIGLLGVPLYGALGGGWMAFSVLRRTSAEKVVGVQAQPRMQ